MYMQLQTWIPLMPWVPYWIFHAHLFVGPQLSYQLYIRVAQLYGREAQLYGGGAWLYGIFICVATTFGC